MERRFREDLYFRLSAFKITIPSLNQRPLDILPLAEQFISHQAISGPRTTLSVEAQQSLVEYHWPGNVRELQNVIMRALVITQQSAIDRCHLIFDDITIIDGVDFPDTGPTRRAESRFDYTDMGQSSNSLFEPLSKAVKSSEYQSIMTALKNSCSRDQAAESLGISTRTLRHKLQRLREEGMSVTRAYAR